MVNEYNQKLSPKELAMLELKKKRELAIRIKKFLDEGKKKTESFSKELSTKLKTSIDNLYIITNMVKDERKDELMNRIKDLDIEFLGDIPYDDLLGDAIFNNTPLVDLKGSIAIERIAKFLDKIGG